MFYFDLGLYLFLEINVFSYSLGRPPTYPPFLQPLYQLFHAKESLRDLELTLNKAHRYMSYDH